jgi:hypothetical protein
MKRNLQYYTLSLIYWLHLLNGLIYSQVILLNSSANVVVQIPLQDNRLSTFLIYLKRKPNFLHFLYEKIATTATIAYCFTFCFGTKNKYLP